MAQVNLAEYKRQLELDPHAPNEGKWYARGTVHHDDKVYKSGVQLPELTNGQVAQLLDVNALTSVAPTGSEQSEAVVAAGEQGSGGDQTGTTRLDENGNEIADEQ